MEKNTESVENLVYTWVNPPDVIRDKHGRNTETVVNLGYTWVNPPDVIRDKCSKTQKAWETSDTRG